MQEHYYYPFLDTNFLPQFLQIGDMLQLALSTQQHMESETLYEEIVSLSNYWARRGIQQSRLDSLWTTCFSGCVRALHSTDTAQLRQPLIFLQTIYDPQRHTKSKKSGVKFRDRESPKNSTERKYIYRANSISETTEKPLNLDDNDGIEKDGLFTNQFAGSVKILSELVSESHQLYVETNDESASKLSFLRIFVETVSIFRHLEPYSCLLPDDASGSDCCAFLRRILVPLLKCSDYNVQQHLTGLLHQLLLSLSSAEQTEVLDFVLVRTHSC